MEELRYTDITCTMHHEIKQLLELIHAPIRGCGRHLVPQLATGTRNSHDRSVGPTLSNCSTTAIAAAHSLAAYPMIVDSR